MRVLKCVFFIFVTVLLAAFVYISSTSLLYNHLLVRCMFFVLWNGTQRENRTECCAHVPPHLAKPEV